MFARCPRLWTCGLLLCLLAACASRSGIPPEFPDAGIHWRQETPTTALARLRAGRQALPGFTAAFVLTMDNPPPGQLSYLTGLVILGQVQGAPAMRVKAVGPFGNILFDMVAAAGQAQVYVPARATLYQGSLESIPATGMGGVFSRLLFDPAALEAAPGASLRVVGSEVLVPLTSGQLVLDARTALPLRWEADGRITAFSHYHRLPQGLPPVPGRILMSRTDGTDRATCALSDIDTTPPPAGSFDLGIYRPREIKPLRELAPRGGTSQETQP